MSLALVLPLSALLGLTLGLVGGGGAVLGIPLLVYLAGLSPESAIPMNLLIIALASLPEVSGFSQITNLMGGMHAWENHPCDGLNPAELVFPTEA